MTAEDIFDTWDSLKDYIKNEDPEFYKTVNSLGINKYTPKQEIIEELEDLINYLKRSQENIQQKLLLLISDVRKL